MPNKGLDIGLPFKVNAVQAVIFLQSQRLTPSAIAQRLASLGADPERIRQALYRVRKMKQAGKLGRSKNGGKLRTA